jgi:hypothetical protein
LSWSNPKFNKDLEKVVYLGDDFMKQKWGSEIEKVENPR